MDFKNGYHSMWKEALFTKLLCYEISNKVVFSLRRVDGRTTLSVPLPPICTPSA